MAIDAVLDAAPDTAPDPAALSWRWLRVRQLCLHELVLVSNAACSWTNLIGLLSSVSELIICVALGINVFRGAAASEGPQGIGYGSFLELASANVWALWTSIRLVIMCVLGQRLADQVEHNKSLVVRSLLLDRVVSHCMLLLLLLFAACRDVLLA